MKQLIKFVCVPLPPTIIEVENELLVEDKLGKQSSKVCWMEGNLKYCVGLQKSFVRLSCRWSFNFRAGNLQHAAWRILHLYVSPSAWRLTKTPLQKTVLQGPTTTPCCSDWISALFL